MKVAHGVDPWVRLVRYRLSQEAANLIPAKPLFERENEQSLRGDDLLDFVETRYTFP